MNKNLSEQRTAREIERKIPDFMNLPDEVSMNTGYEIIRIKIKRNKHLSGKWKGDEQKIEYGKIHISEEIEMIIWKTNVRWIILLVANKN